MSISTRTRISSTDVAKAAGVSRATVSFVLNGERLSSIPQETRERVMKVADDLGYRVNTLAKGLKNGRTTLVGVLSYERHDSYHDRILHGIYSACSAQGYTPVIAHISGTPSDQEILMRMVDYHVCGLVRIVGRIQEQDTDLLRELQDKYRIPCVIVDYQDDTRLFDCVSSDNRAGAIQAVRHLISLGHTRIGLLSGDPASRNAHERTQGYLQALAEAGISSDSALMQGESFFYYRSHAAMVALLEQHPTAVFAATDQLAFAFREVARKCCFRVPGDIALIGFGNLEAAEITGLSTIEQQPGEAARRAIRCLDERWSDPERGNVSIVIPTRLIVRSSSTGTPIEQDFREVV